MFNTVICEFENNNKLPFFDVLVRKKGSSNEFVSTLYRKKTFTGVYLHWNSLTSRKYKIGLIKCLLDRIWNG